MKRKFFRQRGPVKAAHLVTPSVLGRYEHDGPDQELIDRLRLKKEKDARIKAQLEKEMRRRQRREKLLQEMNEDLNLDAKGTPKRQRNIYDE